MDKFDLKQVTKLEWVAVGAALVAFVASFLPWFSFDMGIISGSLSAWNVGVGGWGPVLLLIGCGTVLLTHHFGKQVPNTPLIWLTASAAAVVIILLRWVTLPDTGLGDTGIAGTGWSAGAGFGLVVGLIVAIASCAGAVINFRTSRRPA